MASNHQLFLYFLLFVSLVLQVIAVLHMMEAANTLRRFSLMPGTSSDFLRRFRTSKIAVLASITLLVIVFALINTLPTFQFP